MNKMLFASVSFSVIPGASAGKRKKADVEDKKIVGVQKKTISKEGNKSSGNPFEGFQIKRKRVPTEKRRENMIPLKRSYWNAVEAMDKESKALDRQDTTTN